MFAADPSLPEPGGRPARLGDAAGRHRAAGARHGRSRPPLVQRSRLRAVPRPGGGETPAGRSRVWATQPAAAQAHRFDQRFRPDAAAADERLHPAEPGRGGRAGEIRSAGARSAPRLPPRRRTGARTASTTQGTTGIPASASSVRTGRASGRLPAATGAPSRTRRRTRCADRRSSPSTRSSRTGFSRGGTRASWTRPCGSGWCMT